jgi:hypothetical protein
MGINNTWLRQALRLAFFVAIDVRHRQRKFDFLASYITCLRHVDLWAPTIWRHEGVLDKLPVRPSAEIGKARRCSFD